MANCFGIRAYSEDFFIIHTRRARELEPIMGVWGHSPHTAVQGAEPLMGDQGAKPPEADEVLCLKQ